MRFNRELGFYEKYIKRLLDIICSLLFIIVFCWLYLIIAIVVRVKMGSPVLFKQPCPGIIKSGKETIFDMYKFRSMTDERDVNGSLLPDNQKLPKFGSMLRSTSLDELPEFLCILKGDMSVVGNGAILGGDQENLGFFKGLRLLSRVPLSIFCAQGAELKPQTNDNSGFLVAQF